MDEREGEGEKHTHTQLSPHCTGESGGQVTTLLRLTHSLGASLKRRLQHLYRRVRV